ncbi:glycosyltransferase family 2 protein [Pseudochrobactrum asaccharolyticum]|uniref:glycosyltransferase family 2 protein n=1 Tax=Pseudochrobactrum asaccharolyticum TaxID=354351 RepID=UPI00404187F3
MPKVSIIVTSYNIEKYIRACLDDIVEQTLQDIEIIVVDDGSTDSTPQVILEYAKKDARIRPVLFEKNTIGGVASAANAGLDIARGDYIGFADGDDLYDPQMFEKLWQCAENAQADLAMCKYTLLDETDGQEKEPAETERWIPFGTTTTIELDETSRKQMLRFISVPWRKLYRRDLVERISLRFPVGDFFYEDNPFHWDSVISAKRIVLLPEKLCKHRVARVGQTMATVDERLLRIFEHHNIIRDNLIQHQVFDVYKDALLQWVSGQLSWVSQRTEGDMRPLLYGRLFPIIDQYSFDDISEFARVNGAGRSAKMLRELKLKNYHTFSNAAGWGVNADAPQLVSAERAKYFSNTVIGRIMYPLRRIRSRMNIRYLRRKLGITKSKAVEIQQVTAASQQSIDHVDLMASMVILQREVRGLRSEIKALMSQVSHSSMQYDEVAKTPKK